MTEVIHRLIAQYGLVAVFLGCVAEGESAAILGGFFAHQQVFVLWQAFVAAFLGAFVGDTFFFTLGRSFADHPYVRRLRRRPGFRRAYRLLNTHPNIFVLTNRYIYGMRLVGGIAAGLSTVSVPRFVILNAISSAVWAALFGTVGYVFGLGAERMVGQAFARHERLLIALAVGLGVAVLAWLVAHHFAGRERVKDASDDQANR
ncbi:DedA family protein [Mesorhizobium sp. M1C.F.Ca.ET.193.01.1.1]|uniref:DedA family protein n=2 Tax=Mesorhizobium TaxID=68287 RepID=UPI000FD5D0F3|nr:MULTISPECIES: DedA family protein [unclassified Mesorhizobium]TGT00587.1 DedA family protein [bacterium M00.F.Ca.ET.177.01.1.1]TGQ54002.1 DedA family protein [Mesorhizobium sp. M1C.F.Ca.ET.210.01.1.1]TGQ72023.1 DedA family protein [Mesorhizobium sp. M1C.F.Ca.ET.212.01.1.1]TGR08748.1 DedA family protein [Mesorhizobium sp. M1C.F.Ca.ET.204.01.1.1]TGR29484.1 DedA family protein [Mesorhizobium sp. M1C.F.Ca.ET.196.01.1.1]